ncbi:peptidase [Actinopolyspora erythraea]|uniref:Aminopeptidase N n=1 Tax=Actinopolyspora erythraea TaxID=414996 RepID=A0A099DA55_9ACTN|nr:M1 family metallopeptidase [Actinopolyspora erythraea]ASU80262.1 peptidase [Actinopolyspora erythraea]KGI82657.1 peptidase [Actinopolyspora erythraea]
MLRRRALRTAVATCAATAVLATPALAGTGGAGAPGVGDSYFPKAGNGGYDVSHYDIRLRYQPENDQLRGTTTIVAEPTEKLSSFNLDFALEIRSVRVNGVPARVERQDATEVTVTPKRALPEGSLATFVVSYADKPSTVEVDGKTPWKRTEDGAVAVGQPRIAEWWFPGSDHPSDKASFDISVAVPNGTEVLSNGRMTARSRLGGWTRWNWRMPSQSATYLAFLAIGQYDVHSKKGAFDQPMVTAYADGLGELRGAAESSLERTPEILDFLSGIVGPYPFETQGGVVPAEGLGFALENQTRPVYSPNFFRIGSNTSVVTHELAHQWFGNSVALDDWSSIWLNEGFASYAEWLWAEHQGNGTAQQLFDHYYSSYPADSPFWQVEPGDPGKENLFHSSVYNRGAMTLHALRERIGDRAMLETVRTWFEQKRGGNATVSEFVELTERISGQRLDGFFDEWLFSKGKPKVGERTGVPATASARSTGAPEPKAVERLDHTHELLARAHRRG